MVSTLNSTVVDDCGDCGSMGVVMVAISATTTLNPIRQTTVVVEAQRPALVSDRLWKMGWRYWLRNLIKLQAFSLPIRAEDAMQGRFCQAV